MLNLRFLLLICVTAFMALFGETGYAAGSFTPGPNILMTGATASARFDVAEVLFDSGIIGQEPKLERDTKTFTGVFYLNSIGWVTFSSGVLYQVSLNCGAQALSGLTTNCHLTGTGFSEIAGDIGFAGVDYIPSLGELSGSVTTYLGDVSLSGIYLPLRPVVLNESLTNLKANSSVSFSIKEMKKYGNSWDPSPINIQPISSSYNQSYPINAVDLSFASTYTFTITDPSGSTTLISGVSVSPSGISKTLEGGAFFITNYCTAPLPSDCPSGGLVPTEFQRIGPTNPLADGNTFYSFHLNLRDKYGNKINTGSVAITYTGTVSAVQDESPILTTPYPNVGKDGLIFSGQSFTPDLSGLWNFDEPNFIGQEISYEIASLSPTDAIHQVILNNITYTATDGTKTTMDDASALSFVPAFTLTATPPSNIQVGTGNTLHFNYQQKTPTLGLSPEIIIFFPIGNGANARWTDMGTPNTKYEPASITDFNADLNDIYNSSWGKWSAPVPGDLTMTGIYSPYTAYPDIEDVVYRGYIHYTGKDNVGASIEVFYPISTSNFGTSKYQASKVKILGQNNARGEYGTIGTNKITRAKLIDSIRKNSALSSRNRTDYSGVDYSVNNGNLTITGGTLSDKRTIVTIGGNITIAANIAPRDHPIALIALTDGQGNGGNIIINSDVTDINASLIAEHSILNSGSDVTYQLYIHGSIISANTLGDTAAHICPYYVTTTCTQDEAAKYDFENLRAGYDGTHPATSATALNYNTTPFIIEYDLRIQTDPPPIVQ